jgi:flagellar basal body-associated protein FliL
MESRPPVSLKNIQRILSAVVLLFVLIIIGGTLYALVFKKEASGAVPGLPVSGSPADSAVFTGIGRLRIAAGPATVILTITFPYFPGDRAFTGELVSRTPQFRELAGAYFKALSPDELRGPDEEKAKAEILKSFNRVLVLGKIQELYFSDFMTIE